MKYFTLLFLIFSMSFICYCQKDKCFKMVERYNSLVEKKNWKEAEKLIDETIRDYPNSPYRENYYYNLDCMLSDDIAPGTLNSVLKQAGLK